MGWIQLAPEDREKYGAAERIPLEYGRWGLKSIDALETQVGWTLEELSNALRQTQSKKAMAAVVWLALRGVGIRVSWDEFDVQYLGLQVNWSDSDEPDTQEGNEEDAKEGGEGKDPEPDPA